jgi:hypothetical protein
MRIFVDAITAGRSLEQVVDALALLLWIKVTATRKRSSAPVGSRLKAASGWIV